MSFFIHDSFIMSTLIVGCVALTGCACSLMLSGSISVGAKRTFLYLMLLAFLHETGSLLAMYTASQELFRLLITLKSCGAYLLETALLLFAAFYAGKRWMKGLAFGIHLLSIGQVLFLVADRHWAETIFMLAEPFKAQYLDNAAWYMIAPGTCFVILSVIMMLRLSLRGRKPTANAILIAFLLVCIAGLSILRLSARDMLYDDMHLMIFLGVIAANLKAVRFISSDAISCTNIHEGFSEAVLIFDSKGRIIHIHDGLKPVSLSKSYPEIHAKLKEKGVFNESPALSEGQITINEGRPIHLQYKISVLQAENRVYGRIINLRDVTEIVDLQLELSKKNRQLELAFSRKQQASKDMRQLVMERERAKILDKVNETAKAYISRIRRDIAQLESDMTSSPDFQRRVRLMHEQLLEITRNVIEEIRATVKKLNLEPVSDEYPEDME